jgi:hypothetical protein
VCHAVNLTVAVAIFLNFNHLAVAKFQQIARQDPRKRLTFACLTENDVADEKYNVHSGNVDDATGTLLDLSGLGISSPASATTTTTMTTTTTTTSQSDSTTIGASQYPILEIAYCWGLAAFRYAKALQRQVCGAGGLEFAMYMRDIDEITMHRPTARCRSCSQAFACGGQIDAIHYRRRGIGA